MVFEKIDRSSWKRNEYFEHYFTNIPCTYSMTVKLDITQIKKKRMKLYPAMLYYLTTIVNHHSEFRTAINQAGELGTYDEMIPSYTIFHEDTETFSDLWTEYMPNIEEFSRAYENDIQRYGSNHGMIGKPDVPENVFKLCVNVNHRVYGFKLHMLFFFTEKSNVTSFLRYRQT